MDSIAGPSRTRKRKFVMNYVENDSDLERELFAESDSDEIYCPDYDEEELSSEDDCQPPTSFSVTDISLRSPVQKLPRSSPSQSPPHHQDDDQTPDKLSAEESTSHWTSEGDMRQFNFTKTNRFLGEINGTEPTDFFDFFFDQQFLTMICNETNAQAERLFLSTGSEYARITRWKELTVPELKTFFGLLFHMGTVSMNRVQDYWKKDRLFNFPIFGQQMGRNRFLLIMRCMHFTSETESEDPLFKVRQVIDYFNIKMNGCYYPGKELSLDESMVLWRGRLSFKQYIKNKRHKYGIKLYMLTEPDGLILKFRVYAGGKDTQITGKGHAEKVVMHLLEEKLGNGHEVYMDNYYNSYILAKKLLEKNTYCTGTLRKDLRDNPKEVTQKVLKKGENISLFRDGIHIGKWKDKRPVTYITNQYANNMVPVTNRRRQITQKPESIAKYNTYMSGVDRQDQLLAFYPCERKTLRWYMKIAVHIFQMLFINSYKIYNKYSGQNKLNLYDYRIRVINSLLPQKPSELLPISTAGGSPSQHRITKITDLTKKGRVQRKICRQCYKNKKRTDSPWHCITCENKPGLCVECFDNYHREIGN
ncbi:unnamed protein product [Parnassius mnemosyne]|uniref:PiggyBac transposable element-derived protein domain-containing protein n=1 Tax=Parnassius mnemosyne TaxID=213953 RepID=A0AAV1K4C9_9NEOP